MVAVIVYILRVVVACALVCDENVEIVKISISYIFCQ